MSGRRRPSHHTHDVEKIHQNKTRLRISREAARLMAEEGVLDFHAAKRKAVERLNLSAGQQLPSNPEIERALSEHLQLFHARDLPAILLRLRRLAVQAMRLLERFEPRLVGSLLSGNVTRFSEIELHVTADTPELVAFFLREQTIPFEETSKRLRFGGDRSETMPAYRFLAEDASQGRGSVPHRDAPTPRAHDRMDAGSRATQGAVAEDAQARPAEGTTLGMEEVEPRREQRPRMPGATTAIEVTIFTPTAAREAPLSPADGRPMKRAALKDVEAL